MEMMKMLKFMVILVIVQQQNDKRSCENIRSVGKLTKWKESSVVRSCFPRALGSQFSSSSSSTVPEFCSYPLCHSPISSPVPQVFPRCFRSVNPQQTSARSMPTPQDARGSEGPPANSSPKNSANILQRSWRYPRGFPSLTKQVYGVVVAPESWRCLREGKLVKDPVIDAWLQLMKNRASRSGLSVLPFKSFHYELLSQFGDAPPDELIQWLWRSACWGRDVWLFPLVYGGHCNLLTIVPRSRTFLFMDGPHQDPPEDLLKQICRLMEAVKGDLDWSRWTFHQPKDYPIQHPMSNDCAILVCSWSYVICTGEELACEQREMSRMRRVIATNLYTAPEVEIPLPGGDCGEYEPPVRESETTWRDVVWTDGAPGASGTLAYCASLARSRGEVQGVDG